MRTTHLLSNLVRLCSLTLGTIALTAHPVAAEALNHGGHPERFSGGGDTTPPECQVDAPDSATESFLVKWHCVDDVSPSDEIRTELWLYRGEGLAGEMVGNYLGFPANVQVTPELLRVATVKEALPVSFKLLARDRAGNATMSPFLSVGSQSVAATTCDLSITTEATEATGGTTGEPAKTVTASKLAISATQVEENVFQIASKDPVSADPCEEIDDICSEDSEVGFSARITFDSANSEEPASGTVTVTPGTVSNVEVTGSGTIADNALEGLEVSGEVTINGAAGKVTLSCAQ